MEAIKNELRIWLRLWVRALTQPSISDYEILVDDPDLSARRACLWILAASLIGSVLTAIGLVLTGASIAEFSPEGMEWFSIPLLVCGGGLTLIAPLIAIAAWSGITHLIARALGGAGSFKRLFCLYAAFMAPLALLDGLSNLIPFFTLTCLTPFFFLYGIVLNLTAINAAHRFGWGKSIVSTLLLPVAGVLLPVAGFYALAASADMSLEDILYVTAIILTYSSALFGCWIFPMPTVILGLISIRRRYLLPFFVTFLIITLVSLTVFISSVLISTEKGWDLDII